MTGIYQIVNTHTGKRYIGSALCLKVRRARHWTALTRGTHHALPLQRAWHKYGAAAFVFQPILRCAPGDLLFFEQRCFDALRPAYNSALTAGSQLGMKRSAAVRARIAAANRIRSPESRAKVAAATLKTWAAGRTWSPESRAKMSASARSRSTESREYARNPSAETRAKMSTNARNRSPEWRAKLRAAARNPSPEARAKMSFAARNRSPKWRAKLGAAARNRSPETRAKLSAAARKQARDRAMRLA